MLYELNTNDYHLLRSLSNQRENAIFISVIENNTPGFIYVDNLAEPNIALIWAEGIDGFYLIGKKNCVVDIDEFNYFIDHSIKSRLLRKNINYIEINSDNDQLDLLIEDAFSYRKLNKDYQLVYTHESTLIGDSSEFNFNKEHKVNSLANVIFGYNNITNIDFAINRVKKFWGTLDAYKTNGIGYCAVRNNKVIGICFSGFVAGKSHSIEIEVLSGYRKLCIGKKLTLSFIQEAKSKNLLPYWDCMQDNMASIALAESTGFTKKYEYPLYWFSF